MHLTRVLNYFVRRRHVPGLLYWGKNRVVPRITPGMKHKAALQLVMEQRNLDVLENPYLTKDEEYRHMTDIKQQRIREKRDETITKRMFSHKSMEDHLNHLNVSKKWE